jgi:hypothetical protein
MRVRMSLLFARDFQKRSAAPPSKNQPESLPVVVLGSYIAFWLARLRTTVAGRPPEAVGLVMRNSSPEIA